MEYRTLPAFDPSGLKVSVVGIGGNGFGPRCDAAETRAVVHAALDAGINLFDTAESYGGGRSEEYIGRALGRRRDEVVLATKFGWMRSQGPLAGGGSRRYIMAAVEASLTRLRTDRIDLYQIHRPDPETPIAETLAALDALVRQGKVRRIGCSNFDGAGLAEALAVSRQRGLAAFVSAQNRYSVLERAIEDELLPVCAAHGIGVLPYYPLARGLLTGKYRRGAPPPARTRLAQDALAEADFDTLEALESFAASRRRSLLELAVSWLAAQPSVASVIAGVRTPQQVAANANAADWTLSDADLAAIDAIVRPGAGRDRSG